MKTPTLLTSFFLFSVAACGNVETPGDGDGDGDGPDSGLGDTTAPTVVSFAPADGSVGVDEDSDIVIVFSEAMDQTSVEAAWNSAELLAGDVTFAWNAAGDTLRTTPNEVLEVAVGTGLDPNVVSPIAFSVAIETSAADVSGNALAASQAATFTTKRRLTVELEQISALTRTRRADGVVFGEGAAQLTVGDTIANLQTKMFAAFEIPAFPAGANVESSTFSGNQLRRVNTPYVLGDLEAFHISAASIDQDAFDNALAVIGDFSADSEDGEKSLDVTTEFLDDLANRVARGNRSQIRVEFPTETNSNQVPDEARFPTSSFALSVDYTVD